MFTAPAGSMIDGAQVGRVSTQTVATGGAFMSFDTEYVDNLGAWASSPNPTRLRAPTSSWYMVNGYVNWGGTFAAYKTAEIWLNGSPFVVQVGSQSNDTRMVISIPMFLTAGYYVELFAYQDNVLSQSLTGSAALLRHR